MNVILKIGRGVAGTCLHVSFPMSQIPTSGFDLAFQCGLHASAPSSLIHENSALWYTEDWAVIDS